MTRNIEINYLNSSGYDLLYPKAIDSNVEVDAIIKEILSLSESDMLDDVLLNMVLPDNKYAVALTVKTPGGRPFNGASVSGITSYGGSSIETDENGYVFGFCNTNTPTVVVTNPFLDVNGNVTQQLNLTGKVINVAEMKATRGNITQITYNSGTRIIRFSQDVEEFDCSAIGGGQNGGAVTVVKNSYSRGGKGGNSGQIVNMTGVANTFNEIEVTVGGIGQNSVVGSILTARGGGGKTGGSGAYTSDGGARTNGGDGQSETTQFLYPPNTVGGAGGGGASCSDRYSATGGDGGEPGGGDGAFYWTSYSADDGTLPGSGGGGAGGGCGDDNQIQKYNPGSGKPGLVGFMWRYKPDL